MRSPGFVGREIDLILNGKDLDAQIAQVLRDVKHTQTIDGVSTLSLDTYDDSKTLLKSGIFDKRATIRLDPLRGFELVQVRKNGPSLELTFEDYMVSLLRKRSDPFKVAPNTTNHVAFVNRLVTEVPGANMFNPPGTAPVGLAPTELARGNPAEGQREDSWVAIRRIADERGWRAFVREGLTVFYAPETWLIDQPPSYRLTELTGGVEYINFDFDSGKPVATAKMRVRSGRFRLYIGEAVELYDLVPANGKWIISEVSRSLFDVHVDVTFTKARPVLPEPQPTAQDAPPPPGEAPTGGGVTFGDGTRRTYNLGPVKPHVRAAAEELGSRFGIRIIYGVAKRSNKSDHPLGLALDYMCNTAQGDALAEFAYNNAGRLRVKYIIWKQRIRNPGGGWRGMANRGNATANHFDHVHISFQR